MYAHFIALDVRPAPLVRLGEQLLAVDLEESLTTMCRARPAPP